MAEKKGAGEKPQEYDENTGHYSSGVVTDNASQTEYDRTEAKLDVRKRKWEGDGKVTRRSAPHAQGFNRSNTRSHLSHAKEMGLNEKEYIKAAEEFFNNGEGSVYSCSKNRYYKYDEATRLLCVCDSSGQLHTFFKVKNKNHFEKIKKQFKLEEV